MKKKCKLQHKLKPFIGVLLAVLLVIGLAPASLFSVPEVLAKDLELSGVLEGTDGDITWKLTALNPEDWDLNKNGVPYKLCQSESSYHSIKCCVNWRLCVQQLFYVGKCNRRRQFGNDWRFFIQ